MIRTSRLKNSLLGSPPLICNPRSEVRACQIGVEPLGDGTFWEAAFDEGARVRSTQPSIYPTVTAYTTQTNYSKLEHLETLLKPESETG